jgi:four helix bundle protein
LADSKDFDLEERTLAFAAAVRVFVKGLPRTVCNRADVAQLARSSASVGANYIEANESLGKKNFAMHIRIARKEAKESRFFLKLLDCGGDAKNNLLRKELVDECSQFIRIFTTILRKVLDK